MKSFATATVLSLAATTQVVFAYNSRTPIRGRLGVNQYWSPNPSEFAYGLPGRIAPVPEGFDPFGYANRADVQQMKNYREAELQHGRVAMLATLGYLVTEKPVEFHPLFGTNGQDIGPAIRHLDKVREVSPEFFGFLAIAIGGFELNRALIGWEEPGNVFASGRTLKESYFPGDVGFDPLGLKPDDPDEFLKLHTKELQNGRLAMLAWAGFTAQELVNGQEILPNLGLA